MRINPLPPIDEVRNLVAYDPETGEMRWKATGRERGSGRRRIVGAIATSLHPNGYLRIFLFGKYYFAHRIAYALIYGEEPPHEVDHIDGNRTNNSATNLRPATRRQNAKNMAGWSALAKGVTRDPRRIRRPFYARLQVDGRHVHIGAFPTVEEASAAYLAAARAHFGEYATARMDRPVAGPDKE